MNREEKGCELAAAAVGSLRRSAGQVKQFNEGWLVCKKQCHDAGVAIGNGAKKQRFKASGECLRVQAGLRRCAACIFSWINSIIINSIINPHPRVHKARSLDVDACEARTMERVGKGSKSPAFGSHSLGSGSQRRWRARMQTPCLPSSSGKWAAHANGDGQPWRRLGRSGMMTRYTF